jgi:hypothetical protein
VFKLQRQTTLQILHQREICPGASPAGETEGSRNTGQLEAVNRELDDAQELKQQITELNRARKAQEEQLEASKCILEILEADKLELQHERDAALTEAGDLRRKSRVSASDDGQINHVSETTGRGSSFTTVQH